MLTSRIHAEASVPILVDSGPVRTQVYRSAEPAFEWIDVSAPDRQMLSGLTEEYGLPVAAVDDFLDPRQLPKCERFGELTFLMLRAHVDPVPESAASVHELTQSFAILAGPGFLLTLHRRDHRALAQLRDRLARTSSPLDEPTALLDEVVRETLLTFSAPLDRLSVDLEAFESSLLKSQLTDAILERVFVRRRRAWALVTMLERTRGAIVRSRPSISRPEASLQELLELADQLGYRARELVEYTDSLLNLQIAVAAHRTNEVVRVLTLMSAIFMPLTFIVGLYGMNFALPEFGWAYGYLVAYALIVASGVGVVAWFRRRGWWH